MFETKERRRRRKDSICFRCSFDDFSIYKYFGITTYIAPNIVNDIIKYLTSNIGIPGPVHGRREPEHHDHL